MDRRHLGENVYIEIDESVVMLATNYGDGYGDTDSIFFSVDILEALLQYVAEYRVQETTSRMRKMVTHDVAMLPVVVEKGLT